jgi:hypothetical protein
MIKNIKDLSEQEIREIVSKFDAEIDVVRKAIKAEASRINAEYAPKLQAGQSVHLLSIESYALLSKKFESLYSARDPYARKLEKIEKINRANDRKNKKNAKEIEQKRIEGLASNLRKLLSNVEKSLCESIIKNDNETLQKQDAFFGSLPTPYQITFFSNYKTNPKSDEIYYESFSQHYEKFWFAKSEGNRLNGFYKVEKRDDIEGRIERDAKAFAKASCDSFACKIIVKTEREIAVRGTDDQIVSTYYKGAVNPWDGGQVVVKTTKGEYVWNTKVILNFSKYGEPFNQWPTRLA